MNIYFLALGFIIGWASFRSKFYLSKKYHYRLGFKDGVEKAHYLALNTCHKLKRIDSSFCDQSNEIQITSRIAIND